MHQREPESCCSVMDEVAELAAGPEPAAFTCEPISFRLVQRSGVVVAPPPVREPAPPPAAEPAPAEVAAPAPAPEPAPEPEPEPAELTVDLEPPPAPYYAADDDDDDDDDDRESVVVRRPARVDPRLTDPDTLERAKRVEVYRVMIEQDPQASIFNRTNSPPRRVLPAPRTL